MQLAHGQAAKQHANILEWIEQLYMLFGLGDPVLQLLGKQLEIGHFLQFHTGLVLTIGVHKRHGRERRLGFLCVGELLDSAFKIIDMHSQRILVLL